MSFADSQKMQMSGITAGPAGEAIGYRAHPSFKFVTINAKVRRNPISVTSGEVLERTIEILVSKADVAKVTVGKDQIRLPDDGTWGKAPPVFRVERILDDFPGAYVLSATIGQ